MPASKDTDIFQDAVCYQCGRRFSFRVPKALAESRRMLVKYYQVFCSTQCECAFNREMGKIQTVYSELGSYERTLTKKVCPQCGFSVRKWSKRVWCPNCKIKLILREVRRDVQTQQ